MLVSLVHRQVVSVAVLLTTVALAVGVAGCGTANKAGGSGRAETKFLDVTGMQKEYQKTAAKLKLPPGISFPKNAVSGRDAGTFEKGVGLSDAQVYWRQAWETEWLEQRGKDEARARNALAVLENEVPKSKMMTEGADEATRRFFAEYLKKAKLGDPSGFQRDVELNGLKLVRRAK